MRADRFGSYSIAATLAGMPSLSRRKSIRRYSRLCPPPRCHDVVCPLALRPPDFLLAPSTSDCARVASSKRRRTPTRSSDVARAKSACRLSPASLHTPSKNSIDWPSARRTIAFFHSGRRPMKRPTRRDLRGIRIVRTSSTRTEKSCLDGPANVVLGGVRIDREGHLVALLAPERALLRHQRPDDHVIDSHDCFSAAKRAWIASSAPRVSSNLLWRRMS